MPELRRVNPRCLSRTVLIGGVALLLAGCGGSAQLSRKALQQHAASLQSAAAEGSIAAGDAARGRSTVTFVHVHTTELRDVAASEASALQKAKPAPGLEARTKRAADLASAILIDLDKLSRSGHDRAQQRHLALRLTMEAKQAERLAS